MAITEHVPGMKRGATRRNVALAALALFLFPITLLVALVYVPVALALNRNGLADAMAGTPLGRLPGLGGTGLKTGAVAFVYLFVLVGIVFAGLPGGTDSGNTDAAAGPSNPDAVATDSETTAVPSTLDTPAQTGTATGTTETLDTPTATDGPPPTARPTVTSEGAVTSTPTPSPNPTPASTSTPETTPTSTPTPAPTTEAPRGPTEGSEWTVTVTRVVDGDTLEVRFPDGSEADVRLLGVDTPEVHTSTSPGEFEGIPTSEAGRDWLRDWGHKASEFARTELAGETVTIRTDPTADRRGSYGRLLVYVGQDDTDFNHELITQGYARLYDTTFERREAYATAERTARSNDVGLWNYETAPTPTPTPTATPVPDGGSSPSGLVVATVHADAAGNDHENENDEYVVFENTGDGTLDLSGWTVSDEADHTYVFGDVTLEPGETVTLYTGSGTDTENEVYWGSDAAIWNNGGDTIIVRTDEGETALERSYS